MEASDPSWLSLLPALVTIFLAFATRQVLPALFIGVVTGSAVLFVQTREVSDLNFVTRFLFPSIGSESYAQILLIYLWCLGGLIGVWEKTGATRHFAEALSRKFVRGRRSSLLVGWLLGIVFHQGGTVSTVLTGSTVKPVADRHRVSHEELSYVVDSTASPVATLLPYNVWPVFVAGLVAGTIPLIPDEQAGYDFFMASRWLNFYAIFAIASTFFLSVGTLPWMGRSMQQARDRACESGELDRPGASPLVLTRVEEHGVLGYAPSLADFLLPLVVLLGLGIVPFLLFKENWINEAFLAAVLAAIITAKLRGMRLLDILDGFVGGCQKMTIGAIVLGLAVTLGTVAKELHTADFLVLTVGQHLPPIALPAVLTLLCMLIAFSTGTSWGTYAVMFPVAIPLAYALNSDPHFLHICFGAVLGGAVFGDQCSPISDTTILSSMFTGCDLMDHVKTQLPLALAAATLGAVCSTLAVILT